MPEKALTGKIVWIAEDSVTQRHLNVRLIENAGGTGVGFRSADALCRELEKDGVVLPDVILTDHNFSPTPPSAGNMAAFRGSDDHTAGIIDTALKDKGISCPIVLYTAGDNEDRIDLRGGELIHKPASNDTIITALARCCRHNCEKKPDPPPQMGR